MGYLARTDDVSFENMKRAVIYGSALASFTVQEFGTDKIKAVSEAELEERIGAFKNLIRFS
jgi:hypothetical protein